MEGKLHQANENRKRRMMNQSGPHHTQKHRNNSTGGFTPRYNKPPAQNYRPNYTNNNGGPPKPGGNNNNNNNNNHHNNNSNNKGNNNNNTNTAPRTGSNTVPVNPKDKSTVNCYECGVVGHFSNECPKKLARIAANTAAPAQQQRRFAGRRNQNNNNGRLYHMTATEAQEAPQTMPMPPLALTIADQFDRGKPMPWLGMASSCHQRLWSLLDYTSMSWRTLTSPCICWRKPWPRRGPHRPVPDVITASRRASACTSMVTGAPVRLLDPSPQTTSRPLPSPTCSPGPQLVSGHRHWFAGALSPSSRTTTVRHTLPAPDDVAACSCPPLTSPGCTS
ncbi:hypothetical protein QYE76_023463 [Lolium multiflorum]|uniref:CCHC-type domain-containing protein n=1 Tax=Lolium multiflorum TaxID=4521 RepID=A0AAD8VU60_LOLMU|nr:hypothetical protein QYE76_023463 [Lolium multiflorum]